MSSSLSSIFSQKPKSIEIYGRDRFLSAAFFADGRHIVSGDMSGMIRRWRVEDGRELGTPMNAWSSVWSIAVTQDDKWIVAGTDNGQVTVWNAESCERVSAFQAQPRKGVLLLDVSLDGTAIAAGSSDPTASLFREVTVGVWLLSTGRRLFNPLKVHRSGSLVAVRFSPDGSLIAVAASRLFPEGYSVRIYTSRDGLLLVKIPFSIHFAGSSSLSWTSDSKSLFARSLDGCINYLDVTTGAILSKWPVRMYHPFQGMALASDGTFLAVTHQSSVSFWDTRTHKRRGPIIPLTPVARNISSMALSACFDIMLLGDHKIVVLRSVADDVPSVYVDDDPLDREIRRLKAEKANLENTVQSFRDDAARSSNLEKTIQELCVQLSASQYEAGRAKDSLNETISSLRAHISSHRTTSTANLMEILRAHEQKHQCETLYDEGRIVAAATLLLKIMDTISEEVKTDNVIMHWFSGFTNECITQLEKIGDLASSTEKHEEALTAYSTALSLGPSTPNELSSKWARQMLVLHSTSEALNAAAKFKFSRFYSYQTICDVLEEDGRIRDAAECFRQLQRELTIEASIRDEREWWEVDFKRRCTAKLEKFGDDAMESHRYDEAVQHFSTILSLDPDNRAEILVKWNKAQASIQLLEGALKDADEVIRLNPASHRGYEMRYAALHGAKRHAEAIESFDMMLLKLEDSSDQRVRELRHRYVDARPTIRRIVGQVVRQMPRVLINTATGRLCDKKEQAEAFEALPIYAELISSMTTELDYARIWREVKEFFRYVMLSHRWGNDEPLLEEVKQITVYKLEVSPANTKLQSFCTLVHSLGFRWAWSDTCCVDKTSNSILQESLVAMFTWYRGSSLTIVHLLGVLSESQTRGDIQGSIWNTRAWTYQEYVAARTVQFYTEDWKPYLGLTMFNHKGSSEVVLEMEQVSGVSEKDMAILQPGLDKVRQKLFLASTRQTTLVEDAAYSLLGIFNVAIPVIYGEGIGAVGRLLEHILTGSGDVTILAWTGTAGTYNSCLPIDLTVYNCLVPPHVPPPMEPAELDWKVTDLRLSPSNLSLATSLYDRLNELPSPSMASSRLRLPGIVFRLTDLVRGSGLDPNGVHVYRATASTFGNVVFNTADDLVGVNTLYLVHPWIRPLLDQEFSDGEATEDHMTRVLRMIARLRQPFGALLFKPLSRMEYRRVAADSLIIVRVRKEAPLTDFLDNIRTIEVH